MIRGWFFWFLVSGLLSHALALSSGETASGNIATLGEVDEVTFYAEGGQHIRIGVASLASSSSVSITSELLAPGGEVVGSVATTTGGLIFYQAVNSGTYRIRLNETGNNNVGGWQVQLFLGSGTSVTSGDSGVITHGQDLTGTMDIGDIDSWTFQGTRGRPVRMGFGEITPNSYFEPRLQVFAPNGELIATDVDSEGAAVAFTPSETGVYRAILTEQTGNQANSYRISLVNLDPVVAASVDNGILTNGAELGGTIQFGDFDVWTFQAVAGQAVRFGMGEVSPDSYFTPLVEIFDPSGARVAVDEDGVGASVAFSANRSGTYTAVVSESGHDRENSYRVFLALGGHVSSADAATFSIGNGEDVNGITQYGDFDLATFEAHAGEVIRFGFGEISPDSYFDPFLEIFDPIGNRVAWDLDSEGASVAFTATSSGVFTAIFSESGTDRENSYRVSLAISAGAFVGELGDGWIANGADVRGSIDFGDFDLWRFEASLGQSVRLGFGEISPDSYFAPVLEVYAPSGTLVASDVSDVGAAVGFMASETGEYRVIVYESDTDRQNSYQLSLAVAGRDFTAMADSGPLANGSTASGMLNYGDFDLWSFEAEAGKTVKFGFGEISADSYFEPKLEIFDPAGARVAYASGDPGTEVTFVASVSGDYTAIVSEVEGTRENSYEVSLAVIGTAFETAGRSLEAGVSMNGGIGPGNLELYAFRAAIGDSISLNLAETSSNSYFYPHLEVYSADGQLVFSGVGSTGVSGSFVAIVGGNYFVVVGEDGANEGGSYSITVDGFTGGDVVFDEAAAPDLSLERASGESLRLSWENVPDWSLSRSPDLRTWSPGPVPVLVGDQNELLIEPEGTEFFRLEK